MAADVVGYSRHMGRDEAGTLARVKDHLARQLEPALRRNRGRLVKLTGDGALAEFGSAVEALKAAIEFQQAVEEANGAHPEEQRIVFRVGLHLGDIIVDGDDIYGDSVNIAARLEREATPSGIVISGALHDATAGRLDAEFVDLGSLSLKNIDRGVQAYRVTWGSAQGASPGPAKISRSAGVVAAPLMPLLDKASLAVLPFQNMSGDPSEEYFVDGLVEDIITALSRISWFFVIARNSSFTYKGKSIDARVVGRELGVRYLVEGSVRKAGGRLRITGQLIDTTSGSQIWAERYEGSVEDVFDLQDRVTSSIVEIIEPKVKRAEITRAQAKPTADLNAYDLYLRAVALKYQHKPEKHLEALALATRAVELDPGYSSSYGLISNIHCELKAQLWSPFEEAETKGLAAAQLALDTGWDNPEAVMRAGMAMSYLGRRHEDGLSYIERGLALNRNLAVGWRESGLVHFFMGHSETAIERFETARHFSPLDPGAFAGHVGTAFAYVSLGDYGRALDWALRALREAPRWVPAHWAFIVAASMAGHSSEVLARAVQELQRLEQSTTIGTIMKRLPVEGRSGEIIATALRKAGLPG